MIQNNLGDVIQMTRKRQLKVGRTLRKVTKEALCASLLAKAPD